MKLMFFFGFLAFIASAITLFLVATATLLTLSSTSAGAFCAW